MKMHQNLRLVKTAFLLLIFFFVVSRSQEESIWSKYDKFEDETFCGLQSFKLESIKDNTVYFSVNASVKGKDVKKAKGVTIVFTALNVVAVFSKGSRLNFIVDGKRFVGESPTYESWYDAYGFRYVETLTFIISKQTFILLASAKNLECRLGKIEFTFSPQEREMIKSFSFFINKN